MSSAATEGLAPADRAGRVGGTIELRYVARAGLLPELSAQTYDSLYKALREAVLNAVDAAAARVEIDFSRVSGTGELTVVDDGVGMSTKEFCEQFMSLGGSSKFGDSDQYGRIGIGSLALLQYGKGAVIETKRAGDVNATRAQIEHSWFMDRGERRLDLNDLSAGTAEEYLHPGEPAEHFTRVRLTGLTDRVMEASRDPSAFYRLLDDLRRALPLAWKESRLTDDLRRASPELVATLEAHVRQWSAPVVVHAAWERDIALSRRVYGDDASGAEAWSGPVLPVLKTLRVRDSTGGSRRIIVAGFLLNQMRATAAWSGITARVQNVAVEEHTFFDVTSDPGFRKYISGEIWILGDVDRERLINIDRSSFNRECADYQAIQRYLARVLVDFKSAHVQRPQRQKTQIRRLIEQRSAVLASVERLAKVALESSDLRRLPSSERNRGRLPLRRSFALDLEALGANVHGDDRLDRPFHLNVSPGGEGIDVSLRKNLSDGEIRVGASTYAVSFAVGTAADPPVVIRNRPREIIFNLGHPSNGEPAARKFALSFALELAFLLSRDEDSGAFYERMVSFLEAM